MSKLRSYVLLNRSLLWLILGIVAMNHTDNALIIGTYLVLSVYNVVMSVHAGREERRTEERLIELLRAEKIIEICQQDNSQALDSENARLRECARDMWLQLLNAYDRKELCELADRLRELGVEEDE